MRKWWARTLDRRGGPEGGRAGEVLEPLTLGDSGSVGVGEPVIAIGNPLNVG